MKVTKTMLLACLATILLQACKNDAPINPQPQLPESNYTVEFSPEKLEPFKPEGGEQTVNVKVTKVQTLRHDGKVFVHTETITPPLKVTTDPAHFTFTLEGNKVIIAAGRNEHDDLQGKVTISFPDSVGLKPITMELTQSMLSPYSAFPDRHPFPRMAEYNVGLEPGKFTDKHLNIVPGKVPPSLVEWYESGYNIRKDFMNSGQFMWKEAKAACPEGYAIPTSKDFRTFVPEIDGDQYLLPTIFYAIKGDGNERAAYRYEYVNPPIHIDPLDLIYNPTTPQPDAPFSNAYLKITGRYLGDAHEEITEEVIKNEKFWKSYPTDVEREFELVGQNVLGNISIAAKYWVDGGRRKNSAFFSLYYRYTDKVKTDMIKAKIMLDDLGDDEQYCAIRCIKKPEE